MREYNEDEIRFLAREIADFFINQTKEKGVVNIDDLVDYMRKSYGVPEELTSNVFFPFSKNNEFARNTFRRQYMILSNDLKSENYQNFKIVQKILF